MARIPGREHVVPQTGAESGSDVVEIAEQMSNLNPNNSFQNAATTEQSLSTETADPHWNSKGWLAVGASSAIFFVYLGLTYSYGVVQLHLAEADLASVSTLSFIGSLSAAIAPLAGIPVARIIRGIGYTATIFIGSFLVGLGEFTASWCTRSIPAMFITQGLIFGTGAAMCFLPAATVPSLWFDRKRGTSTGIVYGGAGIGGAMLALSYEKLIPRVGLENALRIMGGLAWAICLPAALLVRGPRRQHNPVSRVQWHLLKNMKFVLLTALSAIATFPLFVPPFLLPLYANAIGLSKNLGSTILAVWNLASAVGRISMGIGADKILGPINSLLFSFLLSGVSLMVIWRYSMSTGTLILFAILNGFGSGGFFSLMPVVLGQVFGSAVMASALSIVITTWTFGFFMGAPVAGYLLDAYRGKQGGTSAFYPLMFYAGSLTLLSMALLLVVRLMVQKRIFAKT